MQGGRLLLKLGYILLSESKLIQYLYSKEYHATHAHTLTVPSPPTNIVITNITSTSALVRWSAPTFPNGEILLYSISIMDESSDVRLLNSTIAEIDLLLDSLRPFTEYSVTLYAMNSVMGEVSELMQFTTLEDGECMTLYRVFCVAGVGIEFYIKVKKRNM